VRDARPYPGPFDWVLPFSRVLVKTSLAFVLAAAFSHSPAKAAVVVLIALSV